jgi:hypothetical protein
MTSWLNACKFNATSSGTGDFVVSSAVTGYQTPASAGATSTIYNYRAESADLSQWEVGNGLYTPGSVTLARATILSSSAGGATVSFSAAPIVGIVAVAGDMLNIANELQAETGTDNTRAMSSQGVSQAIAANARSFGNIAGRNGGFEVWQGGTSMSVAASAVAYTVDGWYLFSGASQASTVSRQTGNTNGSSYACRVQRNAGQTGTGAQIFAFPLDVDELKKMAGQSVILQFNVSTGVSWSPTSGTLSYAVYTGTGAPVKQYLGTYAGSVTAISGSVNLAQGAAAATTLSSIVAIASNIGQAEIQFTWSPVGTAGANDWFQIDDVSLSVVPAGISAIKPAFERSDFLWDLQRCRRHYETSYSYGTAPGANTQVNADWSRCISTGSFLVSVRCQVEKRATPMVTPYSTGGASGNVFNNATTTNVAATADQIGTSAFRVLQSGGTTTAGDGMCFHWVSDATI